jgi:hypothetical protein
LFGGKKYNLNRKRRRKKGCMCHLLPMRGGGSAAKMWREKGKERKKNSG